MTTSALTDVWPIAATATNGCWSNTTFGTGVVMVVSAKAELAGVVASDEAVIVTTPPLGMLDGAVYIVVIPLVVGFVENVPQGVPPQVAAHKILCPTGVAVAASVAVAPSPRLDGGGCVIAITMGALPTTLIVAAGAVIFPVTEVAVIVATVPTGAVDELA